MEEDLQTFVTPDDEIVEKTDQKSRTGKRFKSLIRISMVTSISVFGVLFLFSLILCFVPVLQEVATPKGTRTITSGEIRENSEYKRQINNLKAEIQNLSRKYNSYTSGQSYLVINTTDNRFFLYRNKKLIREGFCSSGSYTVLQAEGEKKWIFKTPKGKYRILGKTVSPVWRKPDWAFVEEGLPVPPANHPSRWEYGVLGDYALSIGDGYLIHGTIYKRFLGMPVTHGCIRLNDEDLESIYNNLNIGSRVYIF
ncbi:MAG: L,D-transpeptidase [Bacteroidales bacterium]|nr:L,D-transpeptidase [Bacteroidales bacterium]